MRTGSKVVRVLPNPAGGWDVREPGSTRALSHAAQENKAVLRAQAIMLRGGVVEVLDHSGALVKTHTVPGPDENPWWYVPPLPLYYVLSGLFLLQGISGVTTLDFAKFRFWLALMMLMAGFGYVALVLASRRRNRHLILAEE